MKKFIILLLVPAAVILSSGCVGEKTVKIGDNVSVDYIGSLKDGSVFDTSIEKVAKENDLFTSGREYKPLRFTVGDWQFVKGFDEGVIGMKVGDSKTLIIPPEKAYGPSNPQLIQAIPVIQSVPAIRTLPKVFEIPVDQFEEVFGQGHKIGENVKIPGTNINLTIQSIASNVSLSYKFTVGYRILQSGAPWNEIVVKIDGKNITTKPDVKKNDTVQLQDAPWNTTVINVSTENITLRHNAIPDTKISTRLGPIKVHFNETSIIMDQNNELAGKTLIFNVTLRSID